MESMLRLSCRDSVLTDASTSLGPVPDEHGHAYCLTTELYGNTRMLLACLTKAELAKVTFCQPLILADLQFWTCSRHDMMDQRTHIVLRLQNRLTAYIFGMGQMLLNRGVHCRCVLGGTAACGMSWLPSGQSGPAMVGAGLMRPLHLNCGP